MTTPTSSPLHQVAYPAARGSSSDEEPLPLVAMRVAGMFGIAPPELLDWHARTDHDADPTNELYPKVLDSAARCFTDDRRAHARHHVNSNCVAIAARRRRPLWRML